jgi:hypothetical protein
MPRLRISKVTYQIGVAAPVNVISRTARPVAWCERLDPGKKRHNRISQHAAPNRSRFIDVNHGAPGDRTKGSSPYQEGNHHETAWRYADADRGSRFRVRIWFV